MDTDLAPKNESKSNVSNLNPWKAERGKVIAPTHGQVWQGRELPTHEDWGRRIPGLRVGLCTRAGPDMSIHLAHITIPWPVSGRLESRAEIVEYFRYYYVLISGMIICSFWPILSTKLGLCRPSTTVAAHH